MTPAQLTIKRWREGRGILAFVEEQFKAKPMAWQVEPLLMWASRSPEHQRISLQACAGPGKSCVLAWAGLWFLAVHGEKGEHPNGLVTSVTQDNLKANLWKEYAKWRAASPFLCEAFTFTSNRIAARDHQDTWLVEARSWPKSGDADAQGATFSGLHGKYVFAQADESGIIPSTILRAAEQALSRCLVGKLMQAGNPISLDGMLHEAASRLRSQWHVIRVTGDPASPQAWLHDAQLEPAVRERAIKWATQQIDTYGRDNPWVKSYILGEFPPKSINALFELEDIERAMKLKLRGDEYEWAQKRLGVDVARFGDDRTVIFPRQGMYAYRPRELRNMRTTDIAAVVMEVERNLIKKPGSAEVVTFVDDTGHWGHGVIDNLLTAGRSAIPVVYSDKSHNPRYYNRKAEMYFGLSDWLQGGKVRLPNVPALLEELVAITYTFSQGRILISDKDIVKLALGRSPDLADALAQTFAMPDMPAETLEDKIRGGRQPGRARRMDDAYEEHVGRAVRDRTPFDD